ALDDAIAGEARAIEAWEKIVEATGDVYNDNLMMGFTGADLTGHWKDELVELMRGLKALEQERAHFRPTAAHPEIFIAHTPIRKLAPGSDMTIKATVSSQQPITSVRLAYRNGEGDYRFVKMQQTEPLLYRATTPAANVTPGLNYFIEAVD